MSSPEYSGAASSSKRKPRRATPRKAAPRGKWSEQQLMTSNNSAAWSCLEEDEKRQILALLPADTHPGWETSADNPDAKIPPLPDSFVRYSNNWRDGIRQFQLDLQNGRYEPEWLRQAEEARQQRERGDFDAFKDREFEQFWGQKQRMDMRALAGESGRIKLGELVDAGVILLGDVWRFTFVFGRGAQRVVIDKEARVHAINNSKLTFKVPPGQRVFLRHDQPEISRTENADQNLEPKNKEPANQPEVKAEEPEERHPANHVIDQENPSEDLQGNDRKEDTETKNSSPSLQVVVPGPKQQDSKGTVQVVISKCSPGQKRRVSPAVSLPETKRRRSQSHEAQSAEPEARTAKDTSPMGDDNEPSHSVDVSMDTLRASRELDLSKTKANAAGPESPRDTEQPIPLTQPDDRSIELPAPSSQDPADGPEIILRDVTSPLNLVRKLIEIDGRKDKNARTANAWKEIRCYRNNQDIGGLWDLRQAWYLKQR
ncbi:hypothetical protein N7492_003418 [Penicillium capsulatum]|uniref:DEUBAD domain-containing protein n=1 Tax=Penicillium capsulatum TaxID=69766 RepID=A0A9W9IJF9_9EURO|nr:hypothetical protein N7492_003418 [Penicillium capsulatum]KAJ6121999.1 hypothetical protein N7512_004464 [Penicillium capsulatum]